MGGRAIFLGDSSRAGHQGHSGRPLPGPDPLPPTSPPISSLLLVAQAARSGNEPPAPLPFAAVVQIWPPMGQVARVALPPLPHCICPVWTGPPAGFRTGGQLQLLPQKFPEHLSGCCNPGYRRLLQDTFGTRRAVARLAGTGEHGVLCKVLRGGLGAGGAEVHQVGSLDVLCPSAPGMRSEEAHCWPPRKWHLAPSSSPCLVQAPPLKQEPSPPASPW